MARVRIYGVEVADIHVPRLVNGLTNAGTPAALAAAGQIGSASDRHNNSAGPLTVEMRDAILAVLATSPPLPRGLQPLRQALLQDHNARRVLTAEVTQ